MASKGSQYFSARPRALDSQARIDSLRADLGTPVLPSEKRPKTWVLVLIALLPLLALAMIFGGLYAVYQKQYKDD